MDFSSFMQGVMFGGGSSGGGGSNATFSFTSDGKFQYPENLIIPNTVTSIPANAETSFYKHSEIKTITFESGSTLTALSLRCFAECRGLEEVNDLPATVTGINNYAFQFCASLKEIILPLNLTGIGAGAFYGCTALKKIVFQSVPTLSYATSGGANSVFYQTVALEDVTLPAGWNQSFALADGTNNFSNVLTHDCIVGIFNSLADFSGGAAHQLYLGATNLARVSAEEKAVAEAKNWTLA